MKRLFFGFEIKAPWHVTPPGKIVQEQMRHLTLAFLGNIEFEKLETHLSALPLPQFQVGLSGFFDRILYLPPRHPHVVAWHGILDDQKITEYVVRLHDWLKTLGIERDLRLPWLPHVTLARSPFERENWNKNFLPLPFYFCNLHLYESKPNLQYTPIWSASLLPPYDELEHTADLAFQIRAENEMDLYQNAFTALAFHFPPLIEYKQSAPAHADKIVSTLNHALALADAEKGCPFKAVSHHGEIIKQNGLHTWEMIVDV